MSKTVEMIIKEVREPDKAFDYACAMNFFAGDQQQKMPVEDSRKIYEHIKDLIEDDISKKVQNVQIDILDIVNKMIDDKKDFVEIVNYQLEVFRILKTRLGLK